MQETKGQVTFGTSLAVVIVLMIVLSIGNAYLKLSSDVVFIFAIIATALIVMSKGFRLQEVQDFFVEGCKKSILVVLILISVGMVVGAWVVSGIVPSIIYYGLKLLSPSIFLVAGFIVLCVTSFFTGSAYATAGTLGVAFMGIGYGMGIHPGLTAGMVVSGSIFGNKISPFADTTNLATAVAGTELMAHIRSMLYTVVPCFVISAILYGVIGMSYAHNAIDTAKVTTITETLANHFTISPVLLIVPIITIVLAIKKVPPLIALLIGALVGIIAAFIFQPAYSVTTVLTSLGKGFQIETGIKEVDSLLNRGGIVSMMPTVTLAILVLGYGEILQRTGIVGSLLEKMKAATRTPRSLVLTTLFSGLLTDMLTASQYMSIILPGEMLKSAYEKCKVSLNVLSRTLEDGGTIFSYLVPWSLAAVYMTGVLGVPTIEFFPYAFQATLTPIVAAIYALTGFAIFMTNGTKRTAASNANEKTSV